MAELTPEETNYLAVFGRLPKNETINIPAFRHVAHVGASNRYVRDVLMRLVDKKLVERSIIGEEGQQEERFVITSDGRVVIAPFINTGEAPPIAEQQPRVRVETRGL